jgi:chemotaxis response regulator CheB
MPEQTLGKAIRVMLVEDRAEIRRAMASLLNRQPDHEVVT